MLNLSGSVGDVTSAIRTFLGPTRHNRLSDHLGDSLQLYGLAQQYPDLAEAKATLASSSTSRRRNSSPLPLIQTCGRVSKSEAR